MLMNVLLGVVARSERSATSCHSHEGMVISSSCGVSVADVHATLEYVYLLVVLSGVAPFCRDKRPVAHESGSIGVSKVRRSSSVSELRLRENEVRLGGILGVKSSSRT